jgi:uncharacterized protein YndB with AHSA1/START domain
MFRVRVERFINKDIDTVFAAISDHEAYKQYRGVDTAVLLEAGKPDKNGLGALRKLGSGSIQMIERITHFEPPTRMCYHVEQSKPIFIDHRKGEITLQSEGEGTRIAWESQGFMKVPLVGALVDKISEKRIASLFGAILKGVDESLNKLI